jgi:hypothetical protein
MSPVALSTEINCKKMFHFTSVSYTLIQRIAYISSLAVMSEMQFSIRKGLDLLISFSIELQISPGS